VLSSVSSLMRVKLVAVVTVCASLSLFSTPGELAAQSLSLKPEAFKSPVAKKIASLVADAPALKSYVQSFVNTSQASLMCKINVAPTWDMIMQQQASLDEYNQNLSKPEYSHPATQKALAEGFETVVSSLMKQLAVKLYRIDELC